MTERHPVSLADDPHANLAEADLRMWQSVIVRAWQDLESTGPQHEEWRERTEAAHFLTAASGPWAESRRDICAVIDIDPEALRQRALVLLRKQREAGLMARPEITATPAARAKANRYAAKRYARRIEAERQKAADLVAA